jgi:hypothetical protein
MLLYVIAHAVRRHCGRRVGVVRVDLVVEECEGIMSTHTTSHTTARAPMAFVWKRRITDTTITNIPTGATLGPFVATNVVR